MSTPDITVLIVFFSTMWFLFGAIIGMLSGSSPEDAINVAKKVGRESL